MAEWNSEQLEASLPALHRYARVLLGSTDAAEDLVQDTILRAYERAETFQVGRQVKPWLLSILRNRFLSDRRTDEARTRGCTAFAETYQQPDQISPETAAYVQEVAAHFDGLPEEFRSVLHIVGVEGLSYREAADALEIPIGTVMSRLARARSAMRQALRVPTENALKIVGGTDER